ncbi:MAG: hypothetical protein H7A23_19565 [Leptospiraceae bacterium]|nr:hypothetical protein [Leptospiraceae bacterium]MCP5496754.1 hypothetical protein [Leptospiraceae bacterium]
MEEDLVFLEELVGGDIPHSIADLPPETIHEVRLFIEGFYNVKMEAVRKSIQANTVIIKYIPNFIIHYVIRSYIDPPVGAMIAESLEPSLFLNIVAGLEPQYIYESIVYLNAEKAAMILFRLNKRLSTKVFNLLLENKPNKLLDILLHVEDDKIFDLARDVDLYKLKELEPLSEGRTNTLERIKAMLL